MPGRPGPSGTRSTRSGTTPGRTCSSWWCTRTAGRRSRRRRQGKGRRMEDVQGFHGRAVEAFGGLVRAVGDERWAGSTPCAEWDVRALVNHLVGENLWTPPLFEGKTIADVGDAYDGDVLGADPKLAWDACAGPAVDAVQGEGAMDGIVHLSFGDF